MFPHIYKKINVNVFCFYVWIILLMWKAATRTEFKLTESRSIDRSRLIQIDKKYALMDAESQRQVTSQLQSQLDYLLGKKEREAMKKKRIQELEEVYQKERENRKSRISFKISRSDKNREMTLKERKVKTKRELEWVDKVKKKVQHENEEELEKNIQKQIQFSKRRTDSRSSHTSLNGSKSMRDSKSNFKRVSSRTHNIDSEIQKIEARIEHAKTNSLLHHNQISEKAKGYSKDYHEVMDKIKTRSFMEEAKCYKDYYKRATHIVECSQKSKNYFIKESEKKKKNINQRFSRASTNLKQLDRQREQKYQQLQQKFNKSFAPKTWKDQKNVKYLQKFLKNQKQIEQQKIYKAENILKKHIDLSLKNRALREKKDRILQTVKKIEY